MSSREPCFTKVPNIVLEALITSDFSSRELRVILAIIRLTLGFHREEERISASVISKSVGIDRSSAAKVVNELIERNALTVVDEADFTCGRILSLNVETALWKCKKPTVVENTTPTVGKYTTPTVGKYTTPSYYIKENSKKITKESRMSDKNFKNKKASYNKALFEAMLNRDD